MARKMKRESRFSCGRRRCFSLSQQPGHKRHAATSRSTPPRTTCDHIAPNGATFWTPLAASQAIHHIPSPRGCSPFMARPCPARCTTASRRTPPRTMPPPTLPNALTSCVARGDISSWQGPTLASHPATPTGPPCSASCHARGDIMSCQG